MTSDALSSLEDALASEDDAAILEAFWALEDAVAADVRTERRFARLATAVRYVTSPGNAAFRSGGSYLRAAVDLDETRADLSLATFEYLAGAGSVAAARENVQDAFEAYETSRRRREELASAGRDADVPAVLAFEGIDDVTVPVGRRLVVDLSLSNVGSEAASDVRLEVSDAFGSRIDPPGIDALDPGRSATPKVTIAPDRVGSAVVTATASTDRTGDDVSFGVEALDARGYIARARRRVVAAIELVETRGSGRRGGPSIGRQLDRVVTMLDAAADAVERDAPSGSVEGKLGATVNVLEAVRNRLANRAGTGLDEVTVIELDAELAATVETVEHAIDAE